MEQCAAPCSRHGGAPRQGPSGDRQAAENLPRSPGPAVVRPGSPGGMATRAVAHSAKTTGQSSAWSTYSSKEGKSFRRAFHPSCQLARCPCPSGSSLLCGGATCSELRISIGTKAQDPKGPPHSGQGQPVLGAGTQTGRHAAGSVTRCGPRNVMPASAAPRSEPWSSSPVLQPRQSTARSRSGRPSATAPSTSTSPEIGS